MRPYPVRLVFSACIFPNCVKSTGVPYEGSRPPFMDGTKFVEIQITFMKSTRKLVLFIAFLESTASSFAIDGFIFQFNPQTPYYPGRV